MCGIHNLSQEARTFALDSEDICYFCSYRELRAAVPLGPEIGT